MSEFEDGFTRMCDEILQLQAKKGPHYDHWLKRWAKALEEKGPQIADRYDQRRWLFGMQAFLQQQEAKRKGVY